MATAQACPVSYDCSCLRDPYSLAHDPVSCKSIMGSVGSLIEKQDFSHGDATFDLRTNRVSLQPSPRKGATNRELLSYLNLTRKEGKGGKKAGAALPFRREHSMDERENGCPSMHCRDRRATDFTKTSLPERGRYDKSRIEPSSFKPIGVKNFFSMESLSPSGGAKLSQSQNSLNATVPRGPLRATHLHTINQDEREEEGDSLTDSGPCSVNSVPCYTPATGPPRSPLSASTGHINHIGGSLDRATRGRSEQAQCRSMAVLNRLYSAGDPPPPYECPGSLEDVLQKMEEQLQQKGVEARPLQRSPNGNKYPFAQVCEDKRRLWLEELDELKQMYVLKLQQVSQQALRSQRILQLQLYKVQQEKKRLQEELTLLRTECEELKQRQLSPAGHNPKLEESKWEVSQKAGEISLLRKQLQDSQSALAQKAGEVFSLKTQLKEARAHEKEVTGTEEHLWTQEHPKCLVKEVGPGPNEPLRALQHPVCHGLVSDTPPAFSSCETDDSKCLGLQGECSLPAEALVEHLQAALRLERRQSEALLGAFETERRTWKQEKERVLKYQREIQTGYTEMYQRSQALERELQDLKRLRQDSKTPTSLWIGQADSSDT